MPLDPAADEPAPRVGELPGGPDLVEGGPGEPAAHALTFVPVGDLGVGEDHRAAVAPVVGEAGELLVRGPQVFQGYINVEDDEQPFHEDWFDTGDMAVMEEDGFIKIVSRTKEMIITGGFNVYPAEVEEVLTDHPQISTAGVVGLEQEDGSEEVVAAVVLEEGVSESDFDAEEAREWSREALTRYKVPRQFFVVDELPADMIGKIRRREVKDLVESMIEDKK